MLFPIEQGPTHLCVLLSGWREVRPFAISRAFLARLGRQKMTRKVQLGLVVLIVIAAHGPAGCGPEPSVPSSPSPLASSQTPPTPPAVPQPLPTVHAWLPGLVFDSNVSLSGFVFETAQGVKVPIERAWVYCEQCGEETHAGMYTDKQGFFSFKGAWGTAFPISVRHDDYQDRGWRNVTLNNGNTRFDVELERK
jgi:hypothetical protein